MPDLYRNAFGHLLVDPDALPREHRVEELVNVAGRLKADTDRGVAWLGYRLHAWLSDGGRFDDTLGIRPPAGSRQTHEQMLRAKRIQAGLLRLAIAVGSDGRASRILRGDDPCPDSVRSIVDELRRLRAPSSRRAFVRARSATRK